MSMPLCFAYHIIWSDIICSCRWICRWLIISCILMKIFTWLVPCNWLSGSLSHSVMWNSLRSNETNSCTHICSFVFLSSKKTIACSIAYVVVAFTLKGTHCQNMYCLPRDILCDKIHLYGVLVNLTYTRTHFQAATDTEFL